MFIVVLTAAARSAAAAETLYLRGESIVSFELKRGKPEWAASIKEAIRGAVWKFAPDGSFLVKIPGRGTPVGTWTSGKSQTFTFNASERSLSNVAIVLGEIAGSMEVLNGNARITFQRAMSSGMGAVVDGGKFGVAGASSYTATIEVRLATPSEIAWVENTDARGDPLFRSAVIPLNATFNIKISGATPDGPFAVAGRLVLVPTLNRDAVYAGGRHPLDFAIFSDQDAYTSGVRGAVYFATNSQLDRAVGAAQSLIAANLNVCSITANAVTGDVVAVIDPQYAIGNTLNVATLGSGFLAVGKQIQSGRIELRFNSDRVTGRVRFTVGGEPYEASLAGSR
jgi:hypothetical protein